MFAFLEPESMYSMDSYDHFGPGMIQNVIYGITREQGKQ